MFGERSTHAGRARSNVHVRSLDARRLIVPMKRRQFDYPMVIKSR